jgi:hypothetical protein
MEKQVSIVVAASGEIKDIALSEGATVSDVLSEIGLVGYQLSRKGGELMESAVDLFSEATDLEKFYATPEDVSVGWRGSAPPTRWQGFVRRMKDYVAETWVGRPDMGVMMNGFKKKESGF